MNFNKCKSSYNKCKLLSNSCYFCHRCFVVWLFSFPTHVKKFLTVFSSVFSVTDGSLVLQDLTGVKRLLKGSKHSSEISQLFSKAGSPTVRRVDKLLQAMLDKLRKSLHTVDKWATAYRQNCFSYAVMFLLILLPCFLKHRFLSL